MREQYESEMQDYRDEKQAYDKAREEAISGKAKTYEAKRQALQQLGPEPRAPLFPTVLCDEPTWEGLFRLLQHGQPSVGVFAAEGATFLGGHGMTDETKQRTAGGLSHLWDGTPVRRVRANENVVLPGRRVAVHLMAQPSIAARFTRDPILAGAGGQGLLNRFLTTWPESAAGTRFFRYPPASAETAIREFAAQTRDLITQLSLTTGEPNTLQPRPLELSPSARQEWIRFQHAAEKELLERLANVRGFANKLPEHAARLAAVLTLFNDPEAATIETAAMGSGIELAMYYAAEAVRIEEAGAINSDLQLAETTRLWCLQPWPHNAISLPDLYQRGPNAIRSQDVARKVVTILEEHGHLIRIAGGTIIAGQKRRDAWLIIGKVGQ